MPPDDTTNVVRLEVKTEVEMAASFKAELEKALVIVTEIMNAAKRENIMMNFQIGIDSYGRHATQNITAVKPL